jgi:hypothetical protein
LVAGIIFVMYVIFIRIYKHNLKTGAITRFNAEAL